MATDAGFHPSTRCSQLVSWSILIKVLIFSRYQVWYHPWKLNHTCYTEYNMGLSNKISVVFGPLRIPELSHFPHLEAMALGFSDLHRAHRPGWKLRKRCIYIYRACAADRPMQQITFMALAPGHANWKGEKWAGNRESTSWMTWLNAKLVYRVYIYYPEIRPTPCPAKSPQSSLGAKAAKFPNCP